MSRPTITDEHRRRLLVRNQFTERVGRTPSEIADHVVGLHSSDPVSVYLSLAARLPGLTVGDVDNALYDRRSLVRLHAMRRTLWVMSPELASVAHSATTSRYLSSQRNRLIKMMANTGPFDDEWIAAGCETIVELLTTVGPMRTREIGAALPELAKQVEVAQAKSYASSFSAHSRLLLQLGFEGRVVRGTPSGSWVSSEYRWHLMEQWTPSFDPGRDPKECRIELVTRWLDAYGPGTARDISWWTGLPLGLTREAIAGAGTLEVSLDGDRIGYALESQMEPTESAETTVVLLPGLDPATMGWKERDFYLDRLDEAVLFDRNGNGGPTIWVDGRIVGGWAQDGDGAVRHRLTRDIGSEAEGILGERMGEFEKFWGDTRFKVRFPSPIQKQLLG